MPQYADITPSASNNPVLPGIGDFSRYYLNYAPEAGFWRYLLDQNLAGTTPQARFAQNQYNTVYGKYLGEVAKDPQMGFYDYLLKGDNNLAGAYMNQSPSQRFDFTSRSLTPRARFVPYSG